MTSWLATLGDVGPQMAGLHSVAVNKNEIVVTDFHTSSLKVYGASRVPFMFGFRGKDNGQFSSPMGVVVASDGNIL